MQSSRFSVQGKRVLRPPDPLSLVAGRAFPIFLRSPGPAVAATGIAVHPTDEVLFVCLSVSRPCFLPPPSRPPLMPKRACGCPARPTRIADQLQAAGLKLDPKALGDLDRPPLTAIASLGGCSAAFLTPQGLVATNHHCVYGSIQYNSKPGQDYLTDGFLAPSLATNCPPRRAAGSMSSRICATSRRRCSTARRT